MSDELAELQRWYQAQCDGDWEHDGGIAIGTLDNPGWQVSIYIVGTALAGQSFTVVEEKYDDDTEWLSVDSSCVRASRPVGTSTRTVT